MCYLLKYVEGNSVVSNNGDPFKIGPFQICKTLLYLDRVSYFLTFCIVTRGCSACLFPSQPILQMLSSDLWMKIWTVRMCLDEPSK